ncbi:DUF4982 domain-containing protein [Terrimonas sp. NA20]|uniref:DUF4982 domain-containing protein n=1 Tax=Terrimonas ginsenosidimutans TaxID=2908004 RepID=A0ABS9KR80_9BACT|nr:beta-galactosidase GalB [Terrimonas ginsenosidimutans]MCG2614815.1 DUF4982 domain-containing protein [Terrimonas ginsenosidimutans]
MMRSFLTILFPGRSILLAAALMLSPLLFAQKPRTVVDFNGGWKFALQKDTSSAKPSLPEASWRVLDLPHDWSIEGEFRKDNPATTQGGALPGGIGWYKKTFVVPADLKDKNLSIEFDGVYRNSEVWINGRSLGKRPYGYISFQYDLTPYIKPAPASNLIEVRVDNGQQPNSRWYTGSGIYRNVRLVSTSKLAVKHWGSFVTAAPLNAKQATVNVETNVKNTGAITGKAQISYQVLDQSGKLISSSKIKALDLTGEEISSKEQLLVNNPVLWSTDKPFLYKLVTTITQNGKLSDQFETTFGIRSFYFDADKGFFLNGRSMKIKGVCMHHDLGALGAAVNTRAIERQLEILKAMGCNAIRTAHNPSAPELLELCDKMGFLVMVEAFDMWKKKKNKFDYFTDFEDWHVRDLQDMVLRDRNHPSVFMWSVGNEIREQFDSTGITITKELVDIVKAIDTTRPVIAALSEWNPEKNFMYKSKALDLVALNYHHEVYDDFQKHYPGQKFLGAENMSALATRGHYEEWPSDSTYLWPAKSPLKYVENGNADYTVSAYDQVAAYWGSTHEQTWKLIKKHKFLSGLFVWTGFDYLGEPTPYPWPARSSYFGIVDLAGFPKDVYYMYQSEWSDKNVLHILPHWNHEARKSDKPVDVWVYYNNADEVELFLNGQSLGAKRKGGEDLHLMWRVPFQPGELKAVSRKNGRLVKEAKVETAGEPAKIELTADRSILNADGKDLAFVTARILDKNGRFVALASTQLEFEITGEGQLAATDNGYQADTTSFQSKTRQCWKGMALGIIRAGKKQGNITLTVKAPGMTPAVLRLRTSDHSKMVLRKF